MSEFISWVEKDGDVLFLTQKQLNSPRGQELLAYREQSWAQDPVGHGDTRWFYGLGSRGGKTMECDDFSSPENFPAEIARAIKAGEFRGLGLAPELLNGQAWAEFYKMVVPAQAELDKVVDPARAELNKVINPARAELDKVVNPAWAEFYTVINPTRAELDKVVGSAWAEFYKVINPAQAEFYKVVNPAWAEFYTVINPVFWDLFAIPENRAEAWK